MVGGPSISVSSRIINGTIVFLGAACPTMFLFVYLFGFSRVDHLLSRNVVPWRHNRRYDGFQQATRRIFCDDRGGYPNYPSVKNIRLKVCCVKPTIRLLLLKMGS